MTFKETASHEQNELRLGGSLYWLASRRAVRGFLPSAWPLDLETATSNDPVMITMEQCSILLPK
jgi:hypothetical protein